MSEQPGCPAPGHLPATLADSEAGPDDLIAFRTAPIPDIRIVPASRWRDWMAATHDRFANLCLPMLRANESGWVLLNPHSFTATWDGGEETASLTVVYDDGDRVPNPAPAESFFGYGLLTWRIPFLFRTPAGYDLHLKGPANEPKDGIAPLEAIVETDWAVATFTMNWKLTRAGVPVRFERDESFAMLAPRQRTDLERFRPSVRDIRSAPQTIEHVRAHYENRHNAQVRQFLAEFRDEVAHPGHTKYYFQGRLPDGTSVPGHRTKIPLAPFDAPPEDQTDA